MDYLVVTAASIVGVLAFQYWKRLEFVNFMPGYRPLLSPLSPFGMLLPNSSSLNPGSTWYWHMRASSYFNKTHDIISIVPLLGSASYYTCSLDVMKQVLGADIKAGVEKPFDMTLESDEIRLFGPSLASVNGDSWRRHRRVVQPAFTTKLIGSQVTKAYQSMVEAEGWQELTQIDIIESQKFMLSFTLAIISKCGFGIDTPSPSNHVLSQSQKVQKNFEFSEALNIVSRTLIPRIVLPNWIYSIPIQRLQQMGKSWNDLSSYMMTTIHEKKPANDGPEQDADTSGNLLARLITSWVHTGKYNLTEEEVIGNMYTLMFAGHETTASALLSVFVLLAIHQEIQEKVFQEIKSVQNAEAHSNINTDHLIFTKFCLWEALRLYPSANFLPRELTQDMTINVQRPVTEKIVLRKGSWFMCDLISIFRNPHTFPQPDDFIPERWNGVSEHDVAMFGVGPRVCIGRQFAQVEALHILSTILSDWHIEILTMPAESSQMYEHHILSNAGQFGTAFGLQNASLKLIKRF
ncbi:cytochrome P450 [Lentinula raphanica]|nr:cytochrome P450 [Lentinula raphanica]